MDKQQLLSASLAKLQSYIEGENYKGYDPYDALKSPFLKLPFLRSNKLIRFGSQQLVKRSSLNLRPLLFVPKGLNPVTLGLCIQAYSELCGIYPEKKNEYTDKINKLITELKKLIPHGFKGACWGYDFDWEARYAKIPAYQPTVVATGIITNGLYVAWQLTGNKEALSLCESAGEFVIHDLNRTYDNENNFCFSYSPFDKQVVFNASMKGARLLAQLYEATGKEEYKTIAGSAVAFVMNHQRSDGAWIYSTSDAGTWVDNYHTGYVLDCLHAYQHCCNDLTWQQQLEKGINYYLKNFFEDDGMPKFYDKKSYPVDCTAAGQSLLTLALFGHFTKALDVAAYMTENMQSKNGSFYFRKYKNHTEKISFMRWSNAWMFAGMATLLKKFVK
ncbi:MAG: delta-aminolevulinic acid dehydratase [Bacteroidetes bacterium]|jgi:rhamnogalacturonyl hydrolase YesR|nr:delta-aminolevulinic acid dehydratase [Bacteroidota bacterium]